jgi:hypothetical protein
MIPTWAVFVIILVIVVGYFLLSNTAKQRRRESIAGDFAKLPNFHANQVFTDVQGESAIGIDDRGRRIAVARKHTEPRTRLYSFSHIISAEVVQDGTTIAGLVRQVSGPGGAPAAPSGERLPGQSVEEGAAPSAGTSADGSLFGSTARPAPGAPPAVRPARGPLTMLGIRVAFEEESDPGLLLRVYAGKPIDADSVAGEKAFGAARTCFNAFDIVIKRAALPPRPAISGRGLEPRL